MKTLLGIIGWVVLGFIVFVLLFMLGACATIVLTYCPIWLIIVGTITGMGIVGLHFSEKL